MLEYCVGGDLWDYIKSQEGSRLAETTARPFVRQLVSALHYLHERGVVHRWVTDLRPSEVRTYLSIVIPEHNAFGICQYQNKWNVCLNIPVCVIHIYTGTLLKMYRRISLTEFLPSDTWHRNWIEEGEAAIFSCILSWSRCSVIWQKSPPRKSYPNVPSNDSLCPPGKGLDQNCS